MSCYSVPVSRIPLRKKSVCVCVCVSARAFPTGSVIYKESSTCACLDILVYSGPLKDKAVWGSAKAKFSLQVLFIIARGEEKR